jgi:hypothetical protein
MFNQNDFFTLDTDLTTAIPLTTVVACNACSDQDPHDVSAKVSHDGIAIITNDARVSLRIYLLCFITILSANVLIYVNFLGFYFLIL